jgi:hypothetical protein
MQPRRRVATALLAPTLGIVGLLAPSSVAVGAIAESHPSSLAALSFASADDGWAVGTIEIGGRWRTLIQHIDPAGWHTVDSPSSRDDSYLEGVAATSASDAWAVGHSQTSTTAHALMEHWDGQAWTLADPPPLGGRRSVVLTGISALSASDVWAVGYTERAARRRALAIHWDGQAWSVESPDLPAGASGAELRGVSAFSTDEVLAVGSTTTGAGTQALVERWDGARWTPQEPLEPGTSSSLYGVDVDAASDAWVVGDWSAPGKGSRSLIEHWDGTSWKRMRHWNYRDGHYNHLACVSAVAPDDVFAVGYFDTVGPTRSLVLRWDGQSWTHTHELHGGSPSRLAGVQMLTPTDGYAVGSTTLGGTVRSMVGRWTGDHWERLPHE